MCPRRWALELAPQSGDCSPDRSGETSSNGGAGVSGEGLHDPCCLVAQLSPPLSLAKTTIVSLSSPAERSAAISAPTTASNSATMDEWGTCSRRGAATSLVATHVRMSASQIAPLQEELGHGDLTGEQCLGARRPESILIHVHCAEHAEVGQGTEDAPPRRGQDNW